MEVTSEDMVKAAADMYRAADKMQEAVTRLDETLERHGRYFAEQVDKFVDAVAHMN